MSTFSTPRMARRIDRVTTFEGLSSLSEFWRELQMRSPDSTVFNTWEWNSVTAQHFVSRSPLCVLLYELDGPRALLPLAKRRAFGLQSLVFLGTGRFDYSPADYQDWLCASGSEDVALEVFAEELEDEDGWDMIWLQELPHGSRLLRRLPGLSHKFGWPMIQTPASDAYYVDLPETWDAYAATLSPNVRTNLALKLTALQHNANARFETVDADDLDSAMDLLFSLQKRGWRELGKKGVFASRAVQDYHRELARVLEEAGMLDLTLLRAGEQPIGARYSFQFRGVHSFYAGGDDASDQWAHYSLGALMDAQGMRSAIDRGFSREDFLRGDGHYKQRYGLTGTSNQDVRIFRSRGALRRYRLNNAVRRLALALRGRKDSQGTNAPHKAAA